MPTLVDLCSYIQSKVTDLEKYDILETLSSLKYLYDLDEKGELKAVIVWEKRKDAPGHFIYFLGANNYKSKCDIMSRALNLGVYPTGARRKGRVIEYKHPERLVKLLFIRK